MGPFWHSRRYQWGNWVVQRYNSIQKKKRKCLKQLLSYIMCTCYNWILKTIEIHWNPLKSIQMINKQRFYWEVKRSLKISILISWQTKILSVSIRPNCKWGTPMKWLQINVTDSQFIPYHLAELSKWTIMFSDLFYLLLMVSTLSNAIIHA